MNSLKNIMLHFLFDRGFDGLFNKEKRCACLCADLMPCSGPCKNCTAGYKTDIDEITFKISQDKPHE